MYGLLLEAEVAAADEDDRVATRLLQLEARRVAGGVADLAAVVGALGETRVLREAGAAVAVPEDVGVLLDQLRQRLGDLGGTDDDDVDALLREVAIAVAASAAWMLSTTIGSSKPLSDEICLAASTTDW